MTIKYLIDENVNPLYVNQIRQKYPEIIIKVVGEIDAPSYGTLDPEILNWCAEKEFILITNNRTSMPVHLTEHLSQNRHILGIFILNKNLTIGENLDELILAAFGSESQEYQDQIIYLPFR